MAHLVEPEVGLPYTPDWTHAEVPFPWERWFGRVAPLRVEIGFGNGEFLAAMTARHPDRNWVGIEISRISVHKADKRLSAHALEHVRLLHGDARLFLLIGFAPQTVEAVYFNCPDPWFKKRHHKHRLLQPEMVQLLANRLSPEGELWVVTDTVEFRDHLLEVLPSSAVFAPAAEGLYAETLPEAYPLTKYMRQGIAEGRRLYFFRWRKVGHPEVDPAVYAGRFYLKESLARYAEPVRLRILEQLRRAWAFKEPAATYP